MMNKIVDDIDSSVIFFVWFAVSFILLGLGKMSYKIIQVINTHYMNQRNASKLKKHKKIKNEITDRLNICDYTIH